MAKALKDILAGVKSSKTEPMDLEDLAMSPEGNKDAIRITKEKHPVEKHDDRAGNDDHIYQGTTKKTTKYKFQKDKVYEESEEELDEKYMGFKKLKASIAAKGGARDPAAVAAAIGRKKYGKQKFQAAAAKGKKLGEACCNHTNEGVMCEVHGEAACPSGSDKEPRYKGKKVLMDKKIEENIINEVAPPNPKIEKWIKANKERFMKEYGKEKGTQVLYAKAWKMHGQSESGPATNTDYVGPGAAGWTTGRMDVGTL